MRRSGMVIAALLLMNAGMAFAQPAGGPPGGGIRGPRPGGPPEGADRPNGIGEQVFIAPSGEAFRAPNGSEYPSASWFAQVDKNHDGRISQTEFAADFTQYYDKLDGDHDGTLRQDEIKRYESDLVPEVASYSTGGYRPRFDAPSSGGGDGDSSASVGRSSEIESDLKNQAPTGGGRFGLINIPEPVASMDVDFSGSVSRQEMQSAARRRFALLDRNSVGTITMTDLPKTFAQLHPRRR